MEIKKKCSNIIWLSDSQNIKNMKYEISTFTDGLILYVLALFVLLELEEVWFNLC